MKILMVTGSLPYPPHQGGALRVYGLMRGLHKAGHKITLLSFHDGEASDAAASPLKKYCQQIVIVPLPRRTTTERLRDLILSRQADIARRLYSPAFRDQLFALLDATPFDLVQFEGIEAACYLPEVRTKYPQIKLCYDAFNAEAALQRVIYEVDRADRSRWPAALYSYLQVGRIANYERELCQKADLVVAVSAEDAQILAAHRPDGRVPVVPNGIDAAEYANKTERIDLPENALVFTGKMDYRPNVDAVVWFVREVLPHIQAELPDAKLYVVGQKPHARLEGLRDQDSVEITGWVKDVRPFLWSAGVYVAPLRMGSGTRLKILEAMAAGCSVVATSAAASGLDADARMCMVIVDDPKQMAVKIVNLLESPSTRSVKGITARAYVKLTYDWSVLVPKLLEAYRGIGLG
ncbi:MAG: glycosyltransferase [Anaerolineae bacterium]|nr:glycosyltransferase [Anaerolineae bacterium]